MKTNYIMLSVFLLFSCKNLESTEAAQTDATAMDNATEEAMDFDSSTEVDSLNLEEITQYQITEQNQQQFSSNKMIKIEEMSIYSNNDLSELLLKTKEKPKESVQSLELPSYYTQRVFIHNPLNYIYDLKSLVGRVVKVHDQGLLVGLDYKINSEVKLSEVNNKLFEKNYDGKVGANFGYLIAGVTIDKESAYSVLLSDFQEASNPDKNIDVDKLRKAYENDKEFDKYYIISAAISTSLLHKKYDKFTGKLDVNAQAINLGGTTYKSTSTYSQDWKVGIIPIAVSEYLKAY